MGGKISTAYNPIFGEWTELPKIRADCPASFGGLRDIMRLAASQAPLCQVTKPLDHHEVVAHKDNLGYLKTKAEKMAHILFEPKK